MSRRSLSVWWLPVVFPVQACVLLDPVGDVSNSAGSRDASVTQDAQVAESSPEAGGVTRSTETLGMDGAVSRATASESQDTAAITDAFTTCEQAANCVNDASTGVTRNWRSGAIVNEDDLEYFESSACLGRPLEILGTWNWNSADNDFDGPLDTSLGVRGRTDESVKVSDSDRQEVWAKAADPDEMEFELAWANALGQLRERRQGKGPTYVRFAEQFNGTSPTRSELDLENADDVEAFKKAWARVAAVRDLVFPEAQLVWHINASPVAKVELTKAAYPGNVVDVIGLSQYNGWPHSSNSEEFKANWRDGAEAWRQFAADQDKPVTLVQWASGENLEEGQSPTKEGGDVPAFIEGVYDWLSKNAGSGPGEVLHDIYDNSYSHRVCSGSEEALYIDSAAKYLDLWGNKPRFE